MINKAYVSKDSCEIPGALIISIDFTMTRLFKVCPEITDTSFYFFLIEDVIKDDNAICFIEGLDCGWVKAVDIEGLRVSL